MADNKKMVEAITSMDTDFAQWYTDVVKKAELCDYASVKGCMVIKPSSGRVRLYRVEISLRGVSRICFVERVLQLRLQNLFHYGKRS